MTTKYYTPNLPEDVLESIEAEYCHAKQKHPAGRRTTNYRCPDCLGKWRARHGVTRSMEGGEF